jgi:hypothetical protein
LALDDPSAYLLKSPVASIVWVFVRKENKMAKYVNRGKEMWARVRADKAARAKANTELGKLGLPPARYKLQPTFENGIRQWEIYFDGKFVSMYSSYLEANQEIIRLMRK